MLSSSSQRGQSPGSSSFLLCSIVVIASLVQNAAALRGVRSLGDSCIPVSCSEWKDDLGPPMLDPELEAIDLAPPIGDDPVPPPPVGGANGDPHFKTWNGDKYDFHGACDLVLLHNPGFADGLGMDIHIRTKHTRQWSYISSAVLRIGDDRLEVRGGVGSSTARDQYWFNGVPHPELTTMAGRFPVEYIKHNDKQHSFHILLDDGRNSQITIKTFKEMVRVDVERGQNNDKEFTSSVGLMGSFPNGEWLGRDNFTKMKDASELGFEWQVQADEPMLFFNVEGPQAPTECMLPSQAAARRRLEEVRQEEPRLTLADADKICAWSSQHEECVIKVLGHNDESQAYAF